jgi:hypothetical protein
MVPPLRPAARTHGGRLAGYCLLGALAACVSACSVDVAKLRVGARDAGDGTVPDAPARAPDGPAALLDGALPDLAAAPEVAAPVDLLTPADLRPAPDQRIGSPDSGGSDATVAPDLGLGQDVMPPADGDDRPDGIPPNSDGDSVDAPGDLPATNDSGVDAPLETGPPALDPDLVLWYPFDESTGTAAADSAKWNGIARNATLATTGTGATATFTSASRVGSHALSLTASTNTFNPAGGYASLPSLATLAPEALTIAVWVNVQTSLASQNWARVFDFGTGTTVYMYLSVRVQANGNNPFRFTITKAGYNGEQTLDGLPALDTNTWHHLAVVLPAGSPYTGIVYLDGQVAGTSSGMTLHPTDLGATTNNWLGRPQFSSNPFLHALLDDFRVYRRALTATEIAGLYASH